MKYVVLSLGWLLIAMAFVGVIPSEFAKWLTLLGAVLLVLHLIEYFAFSKKIAAKGDSPAKAFLFIILFGVFYFGV